MPKLKTFFDERFEVAAWLVLVAFSVLWATNVVGPTYTVPIILTAFGVLVGKDRIKGAIESANALDAGQDDE